MILNPRPYEHGAKLFTTVLPSYKLYVLDSRVKQIELNPKAICLKAIVHSYERNYLTTNRTYHEWTVLERCNP